MGKGIIWAVLQGKIEGIDRRYESGEAHHITLAYGVERRIELEGIEFEVECLYEAWDGNIQAVKVRLPEEIECMNTHPHISMSWKRGISPVRSNSMLASRFNYRLMNGVRVKVIIEFKEW